MKRRSNDIVENSECCLQMTDTNERKNDRTGSTCIRPLVTASSTDTPVPTARLEDGTAHRVAEGHGHGTSGIVALSAAATDRSIFDELPLQSVVKIFTIVTSPNFSMPWQMKRQQKSTSSGFVIEGRRILTNAHSVANQTSVMVRKHGSPDKYLAKVLAVGHECDLAMLTVPDEAFWESVVPLELGGIPNLQDAVIVVGYPTGGDNISVTGGVVSRCEIQTYSHASASLLAIQIDAAINAGNSGGPALRNGKVIGVAFETLADAENIGYIIPIPVVEHFLKDIEKHGHYTGFCSIGFFWQAMENIQFRKSCGMKVSQTGVYINRVQPLAQASKVLRKGDVLLSVDRIPIANDGTIPFRKGERIAFRYLVTQKFLGEKCSLSVLRNGHIVDAEVSLGMVKPLVPVHLFDTVPRYYIYAGLVFVTLSQPYLRNEFGKEWETKAPVKLCNLALDGVLTQPDEQVVVLSQVLAAEINVGYQLNLANVQLTHFNDQKVRNLRHLMELVEGNAEPYARFLFENEKVLVLDMEMAKAAMPEILKQHCIPSCKSADMWLPEAATTGAHSSVASHAQPAVGTADVEVALRNAEQSSSCGDAAAEVSRSATVLVAVSMSSSQPDEPSAVVAGEDTSADMETAADTEPDNTSGRSTSPTKKGSARKVARGTIDQPTTLVATRSSKKRKTTKI